MNEMNQTPSQPTSQDRPFFDGNPKTMFYFGAVCGVAVTLLFNSFMGLSYSRGGVSLAGGGQAAASPSASASPTSPQEPRLFATGTMPPVTAADHVRGDLSKAKVVIVEYSDLQCPFCSRHHPTLEQVVKTYGDKVAWVYRHFPLTSIHPNAMPSALASECASEQGKFWEFADALFADNTTMNGDAAGASALYTKTAKALKLDLNQFNSCVANSKKYQYVVDADQQGGQSIQVQGTPATFINGQMVQAFDTRSGTWGSAGATPYATLAKFIDQELAKKK